MVMVLGETPGALAALPAGALDELLELLDELLHPLAANSVAAATAAAVTNRQRTIPTSPDRPARDWVTARVVYQPKNVVSSQATASARFPPSVSPLSSQIVLW